MAIKPSTTTTISEVMKSLRELAVRAQDEDDKIRLGESVEKLSGVLNDVLLSQKSGISVVEPKENAPRQSFDPSRYQAFRLSSQSTVVIFKEEEKDNYLKDWYCKHCFDNGKLSQLQPKVQSV